MGYGGRYACALFFLVAGFHAMAQQTPSAFLRPPPTPDEQSVILGRVSRESLRYQQELPNLVCTLLTVRSVDQTGTGKHWQRRDRLEVEDVYVDPFLNHKLLMFNGKDPHKTYQQLTGLLSDTVLHAVGFLPGWIFGSESKAKFEWQNWSNIDLPIPAVGAAAGLLMHVFSVRVPAADSRLLVTTDRQSVIAGIDGLIYVDAATSLVRRLEFHMELPAQSVIQDGFIRIDFGDVTISGRHFLLPLKSEVTARVAGLLERNQTEVVRYQIYAAKSTLHFDESSEGAPPNESPPR
jgi:hypothetical protein